MQRWQAQVWGSQGLQGKAAHSWLASGPAWVQANNTIEQQLKLLRFL